jgi:hypothetical protein
MTGLRQRLQQLAAKRQQASQFHVGRIGLDVDVVELVNWVYADQRAHILDGRGIGLHEGERIAARVMPADRAGSGSSQAQFEAIMQLGVRVDKTGYDVGDLHPVAEVINSLVTAMPGGRLIIEFGRRRAIPEGGSFEVALGPSWKVEPRYDMVTCGATLLSLPRQGAFDVVYDGNKHPIYCPLELEHGPDYLAALRAEYVAWHDSLTSLVDTCRQQRDRIGGLIVSGPKLAREPWERAKPPNHLT